MLKWVAMTTPARRTELIGREKSISRYSLHNVNDVIAAKSARLDANKKTVSQPNLTHHDVSYLVQVVYFLRRLKPVRHRRMSLKIVTK